MPFDGAEVAKQIEQSRDTVHFETRTRESALDLALRIYNDVEDAAWDGRVGAASTQKWVALPMSSLKESSLITPSGSDYCVVATDSSFIAPDKHRGSLSHLI